MQCKLKKHLPVADAFYNSNLKINLWHIRNNKCLNFIERIRKGCSIPVVTMM